MESLTGGSLEGVRVLDFTRVLAGPFATRLLADFGAEVIKVQSSRVATGTEDCKQAYFKTWNRNKRSITLDMNFRESRDLVLQLASVCDVVIENFSPRVMANWDLNYQAFREVNPKLVMLSMSGMGKTGPLRDFVAYGQTVQALGGLTYLTGLQSENPVGIDYAFADPISGLFALVAVLAALADRDRTGNGTYIDLSEYEAVCAMIGPALIAAQRYDAEPGPLGNDDQESRPVLQGCYPCAGLRGWCVLSIRCEDQWQAFCRLINRSDWLSDNRFSTELERFRHREELDQGIRAWTRSLPADKIVDLLKRIGVSAGQVRNPEDLMNDPQLHYRNFFKEISSPDGNKAFVDESPIRSAGAYREPWCPSPELGHDNRYVFLEVMGLSETQYHQYKQRGIIA